MWQIYKRLHAAFDQLVPQLIQQQGYQDRHDQSSDDFHEGDKHRIPNDLAGFRQIEHIAEIVQPDPIGAEKRL